MKDPPMKTISLILSFLFLAGVITFAGDSTTATVVLEKTTTVVAPTTIIPQPAKPTTVETTIVTTPTQEFLPPTTKPRLRQSYDIDALTDITGMSKEQIEKTFVSISTEGVVRIPVTKKVLVKAGEQIRNEYVAFAMSKRGAFIAGTAPEMDLPLIVKRVNSEWVTQKWVKIHVESYERSVGNPKDMKNEEWRDAPRSFQILWGVPLRP